MLEQILNQLQYLKPLLELVTTLLWGIYVYFTIITFREIRRQTDLQSEAFLVVAAKVSDQLVAGKTVDNASKSLHEKWHGILTTSLPKAVQKEKYLTLECTNRGRSDIVRWKINVAAEIKSSHFLQ